MLFYILEILISVNPYIFGSLDQKAKALFLIYNFISLVFIPLVSILILKKLKIIKSLEMESSSERIIPLIILGIVYIWLFINYKNASYVPLIFTSFVLGSVISVFAAFFINNFTKISLHTLGMGGFVSATILIAKSINYEITALDLFNLGMLKISYFTFTIITILLAGLVGTSRLYLGRHTKEQVYLGYLVGFLSQFLVFNIIT